MSKQSLILPSLVSLYGLTVLQSAWLHEDAFITLRSVDNFLAGFGPTWNPGERVQAFTHPLWFVVLTIAVGLTGEVFYTSILLGLAASIAAVLVLVLRLAPSLAHAAVAVALLCSSKAFIDFSTSGLGNPLSHLLLALFAAQYFSARCDRRALVLLSFAASLATCTRIDAMLLYVPPLVATAWRLRTASALAALAAGFAPLALWELFSLCYYGFLFPNTAYGKLNTGIASTALVQQGFYYLYNSLRVDLPTLFAIGGACAGLCYARRWDHLPLAAGLLLYLAYTVMIGGDYMSGRFLSIPFFGAALLIARLLPTHKYLPIAPFAILVAGLAMPHAPLTSGPDYHGARGDHHIVDERASYYQHTGLWPALATDESFPSHQWVDLGRTITARTAAEQQVVTTFVNLGILGYYAGPHAHHIDVLGITDPLLSRLPAYDDATWAPGHFARIVAEGYIETRLYGYNLISDPNLATYYDRLQTIISGPLFSGERWEAIWAMHTGAYDHLIDYRFYRYPDADERQRSQASLSPPIHPRPAPLTRMIEAGNTYFARRQLKRAARAYSEAIAIAPDEPFPHHNLGATYLSLGDPSRARIAFSQSAALGSQVPETYRALIWLAQKANDSEALQNTLTLAHRHLPTDALPSLYQNAKFEP
ncbi:MAG: hypothetical protein CME20_13465 [Gemmatimonadetes bacterium]|nr:hypothetical protein [Gemmatimonadota bacterium]